MAEGNQVHHHDPPLFRTHIHYQGGHAEDLLEVDEKFCKWLAHSIVSVDRTKHDELTICTIELDPTTIWGLECDFEELKVGGELKITRRVLCQDTQA